MGIEEGTYALFKLLSQWVIKPAIAEINRVSDFHVEIEYQREGRKVTALKFRIRRVRTLPAADSGQHDLFPDLVDMPLAVKLLHEAGLALQEAFGIWQKGFAFVDEAKRPAVTGDHPDEAFTRYVREKIHLLETRKKQGKANNPTGFLLTALKTNYSNADFERAEAAKADAGKRKELKTLKDGMDAIKRGESDAVATLTRKVIDAMPTLLDEALEAARRDYDTTLRFCYVEAKTPWQNFQEHPAIADLVAKHLEAKLPKQYEEARAPFLRQRADAETRVQALEAEGIRVYAAM
jgi:hypothetical protein